MNDISFPHYVESIPPSIRWNDGSQVHVSFPHYDADINSRKRRDVSP